MGGCEDRTSLHEAEESALLGAIARKRLMKTEAGKKNLGGCGDL
jgi:hypothetical protein